MSGKILILFPMLIFCFQLASIRFGQRFRQFANSEKVKKVKILNRLKTLF